MSLSLRRVHVRVSACGVASHSDLGHVSAVAALRRRDCCRRPIPVQSPAVAHGRWPVLKLGEMCLVPLHAAGQGLAAWWTLGSNLRAKLVRASLFLARLRLLRGERLGDRADDEGDETVPASRAAAWTRIPSGPHSRLGRDSARSATIQSATVRVHAVAHSDPQCIALTTSVAPCRFDNGAF